MKQLFSISIIILVLFTGCNKLKDETLDNNPYDKDYAGPKVVYIANVKTQEDNFGNRVNKISVISTTNYYEKIKIYRNGKNIITAYRGVSGTSGVYNEIISDDSTTVGLTYLYQAKLIYDAGSTSLSDGVKHTTQ